MANAKADIEHEVGETGGLKQLDQGARQAESGAELPARQLEKSVGSSGHVPLLEETGADTESPSTGSSGADADRDAVARGEI